MKKVMMVILDGFGVGNKDESNAIYLADMYNYQELSDLYPNSVLDTTGDNIDTPEDKRIDCEVSHLMLGAGKKVEQDITLANENLSSTLIEQNEKLLDLLEYLKDTDGNLHLVGLISDGKVYSDIRYMKTFITHLKNMGVKKFYFHAITDGRDVPNGTAIDYINDLQSTMDEEGIGKIATICGRSYAMDREENYKKTRTYLDLLIDGVGAKISNYKTGIDACYKRNITDEQIPPIIIDEKGTINDGDVLLWLNYREDRARQILKGLCNKKYDGTRSKYMPGLKVASILPIDEVENLTFLIDKDESEYSLNQYLSLLGLTQARICEEDKFTNLTYYFNGGSDKKVKNCEDYLIESYKREEFIDHPELSIANVTKQAIKCMERDCDFIVVNIQNPDIFGHIGDVNKTVEALKCVDDALGELCEACDDNFYTLVLTSDHGNVECILNDDGSVNKAHTANQVPFIIRDKNVSLKSKGSITQVAGTILKYMDIAIPKEMQDSGIIIKEDE